MKEKLLVDPVIYTSCVRIAFCLSHKLRFKICCNSGLVVFMRPSRYKIVSTISILYITARVRVLKTVIVSHETSPIPFWSLLEVINCASTSYGTSQ